MSIEEWLANVSSSDGDGVAFTSWSVMAFVVEAIVSLFCSLLVKLTTM